MQLGLFNNPGTYKYIKVAWRMTWVSTVNMAKTQDKCEKLCKWMVEILCQHVGNCCILAIASSLKHFDHFSGHVYSSGS